MPRLIDADALMELYADVPDIKFDMFKVPIPVVRQNIIDMPTIDPESLRKKGEWMYHTNASAECSICGGISCARYHFCPNCGADMRPKEA